MSESNPLIVLYGSATGNAEHIAKDLTAKYEKCTPTPFTEIRCYEGNDFKRKCLPVWEVEPSMSSKYGVLIVTSTTGNGDSPENISRFVRWLKRKTTIDSSPMKNVAYAVLALGDSNYDQFCFSGITIDKKMKECGGVRVKPVSCADEGTGLEDVVEAWIDDIVPIMAKACGVECSTGKDNIQNTSTMAVNSSVSTTQNVTSRPSVQPFLGSRPNIPEKKISDVYSQKSQTPLFILYGSATGNAEHISKDLASKYENMLLKTPEKCFFPSVICCELNAYKKKCQSMWEEDTSETTNHKHGLLIVASTTGNGDAPENASRFVRYIKRKSTVESMPFRNVAYAVLGLGDTNYDQFCATGKSIDSKLSQLGGVRLKDLACADEGTGLEEVVDPWVSNIFELVTKACIREGCEEANTPSDETKQAEAYHDENPTASMEQQSKIQLVGESSGVCTIRELLSQEGSDGNIPSVEESLLPSIGASLSSVQLLNENDAMHNRSTRGLSITDVDNMTISSASSSNIHYTQSRPFESTILDARYLTKTDLEGARKASLNLMTNGDPSMAEDEKITAALESLKSHFVLSPDSSSLKLQSEASYERNGKRVIEVTLSLPSDFTLEYQPGDSIGVVPSNLPENETFILEMLRHKHGILPTQLVSVNTNQPMTVSDCLQTIDLSSPIKNKRVLHALSQYATDQHEAGSLRLLASKHPLGESLYEKIIEEQRYNVVDVLKDFPSCQDITLDGLLAILPGISPRYYSITSSPLTQNESEGSCLTIAFAVVDYMTPEICGKKRRISGLFTTYMEAICSPILSDDHRPIDSKRFSIPQVRIFPKPTTDFRLPATLDTPLIFIGPGTGIAPFKGFLDHRKAQLANGKGDNTSKDASEGTWRGGYDIEEEELTVLQNDNDTVKKRHQQLAERMIGEIDVYFGCRHSDHDWIYEDEMKLHLKSGIISSLEVAFSRGDSPREYVQDKMKANAKRLSNSMLHDDSIVYICGDGNAMAKDVQAVLTDIIIEAYVSEKKDDVGDATSKASDYLERMKKEGRLVMDIWS